MITCRCQKHFCVHFVFVIRLKHIEASHPVIRAIIALLFVYCFSGGDELRIRMLMHFTLLHDFDNWINLKHKEEIVRMFFRRYLMCLNVMIILLTCSLYKQVKCVFILVNDSICYIPLALHDVMNFYASKIFYQQLCHFCFKVLWWILLLL